MQPKPATTEPRLAELRAKLLAIAGRDVIEQPEPHLAIIMQRGRLFDGQRLKVMRGETSSCHFNTACVFDRVAGAQWVRGYALRRGVWHQHSWALANGFLVGTTLAGVRYFGAVLLPAEAEAMVELQMLKGIKQALREAAE